MQDIYRKYETEELVAIYQSTHEQDILAEIMERTKKLFYLWGQEYSLVGCDMDDMLQEASIALLRALDTYKRTTGIKFVSYLKACVKQAYNRVFNYQHRKKRYTEREIVSWEVLEEINKECAVEVQTFSDLEIRDFIASLEGRVQEIAINLIKGYSKTDISRMLNITPASTTYHIKRLQKLVINYYGMNLAKSSRHTGI